MKGPSARIVIVAALSWLVLSGVSLVLALVLFNPLPSYNLSKSGVRTLGRVTSLEPTNHQAVRYSYVVDSREYSGVGNAGHGNPEFEQLGVGQSVLVYYDPGNPEVSYLGYPEARLHGNVWVAVMVAIVLPLFIVLGLIRKNVFGIKL